MNSLKSNRGATLLELIITIAVGALVTMAVLTVFHLGLQFHHTSTETGIRQNEVQVGLTVMERLVAQGPVAGVEENAILKKLAKAQNGEQPAEEKEVLLYYDAEKKAICAASGAEILRAVETFQASPDETSGLGLELLTITFMTEDGHTYKTTVHCRTAIDQESAEAPSEEGSAVAFSGEEDAPLEDVLIAALQDEATPPSVRVFLQTMASQLGSTGRIRTADGDGDYYSQWYIGSYADNPSWNEDTPWCACFISWALAECGAYIQGEPARFANVDKFWAEFVTADQWKQEDPQAGDLIFFDWIVDGEPNPQHVGVVLTANEDLLYTIEGNSNGIVAVRKYATNDPRILGYGILNWK